ncbi:hypothetical protein ACH4MM_11150 [Streptomyces pratensis]|uniref:hypothetical protein n=1 Tax=Streptomyces pratensis TaxID=1169025 RepID=UPI0037BCDFC1
MGAAIRHFTAIGPGGQVFTVNVERDFRYDPSRDLLACAHCDWSPSLLTTQRIDAMAWDHLAGSHDATRGRTDQENESFRRARRVMLPLCAVVSVVLLVFLQS